MYGSTLKLSGTKYWDPKKPEFATSNVPNLYAPVGKLLVVEASTL